MTLAELTVAELTHGALIAGYRIEATVVAGLINHTTHTANRFRRRRASPAS